MFKKSVNSATKTILFSVAMVTSLLIAGCSNETEDTSAADKQPAEEVIKVGMSGTYYPFGFTENGDLKGFEVDLWNELSERLNARVEFVTAPFSGLFGMLEAGRIDTISNQITLTPERSERYAFAEPYVYDGAQITVQKSNKDIKGLADLVGKRVAVNLGSNFEQILRNSEYGHQINIVTYDTGIEQDVILGRSDAFIMDRISALSLIKKSGLDLKPAGEPFETLRNAMPFLKNKQGEVLRDRVNKALESMRADGSLKEISNQWFGGDITAKPSGS